MQKKLTNKKFWENYWKNKAENNNSSSSKNSMIVNQQEKDINFWLSKTILQYRDFNKTSKQNYLKILEIGGANGNFLKNIYFLGNCKVASIDFSEQGNKLLKSNLKKDNIKPYKIITGDIFKYSSKKEFNIVYSLGFIEHFENPEQVIKMHLKFIKKDGLLILGLPDLSNLNGIILKKLDTSFYNKHNVEIMNYKYFKGIQKKINCELLFFKKISSYEPNMISYKKNNKVFFLEVFFYRILTKLLSLLKKIYFFRIFNVELLNSYIFVVFKKVARK